MRIEHLTFFQTKYTVATSQDSGLAYAQQPPALEWSGAFVPFTPIVNSVLVLDVLYVKCKSFHLQTYTHVHAHFSHIAIDM